MVENAWWRAEYGDPCRECGFDLSTAPERVIVDVEALPVRFDALLVDRTGGELAPGASWSAKAYVFHVADNLRIFAERLEGVFAGAPTTLAAYDQDRLASARDYESMSLQSAQWSLHGAVAVWASASRAALARPTTYVHAERGPLVPAEIVRAPGHDAIHHCWDVTRAVRQPRHPRGG
jgi:hypothetical protein